MEVASAAVKAFTNAHLRGKHLPPGLTGVHMCVLFFRVVTQPVGQLGGDGVGNGLDGLEQGVHRQRWEGRSATTHAHLPPHAGAVLRHATLALAGGAGAPVHFLYRSVHFLATCERFAGTHAMRTVLVAAAALVACAGPASAVRFPAAVPHCCAALAYRPPLAPPAP